MKGLVKLISQNRGKYAVENETGGFTVFELISSTSGIEMRDEIEGPFNLPGRQKLQNITRSIRLEVSIEATSCDQSRAKELLK